MARIKEESKEYIISQALETEEGRIALAQAMVAPIRTTLQYRGIGRNMLMDEDFRPNSYTLKAPEMFFDKDTGEPYEFD